MHWRSITRLFGVLLMIYSLGFLPSLALSWWVGDGHARDFVLSLAITAGAGLATHLESLGLIARVTGPARSHPGTERC